MSQPEHNEEAVGRDTPASTHDEAVRPDETPSPESVAKSKSKGTSTKRKRKSTPSEGPSSGTEHSIAGLFRVNVTMLRYLFGDVFLTLASVRNNQTSSKASPSGCQSLGRKL